MNHKIIISFNSFRSDRIDNKLGFMIQYQAMDVGETFRFGCGGNFTTKTGMLASPSFPDSYPEDQTCVYYISQPPGKFINITFLVLDIRCNDEAGSDYLEIRDGGSENSPQMLKSYCGGGNDVPLTIQSTQNLLWIK